MKMTRRRVLGIAFEEGAAVVAEARWLRGEARAERTARFAFPEGVTWEEPQRLGKAFGLFLRQQRFAARQAVVGVPAKWLMSREVGVPPAGPEATAAMLRLQAEREFSADGADLMIDYVEGAAPPPATAPAARPVLLVAALRRRLEGVTAMAEAARVRVLSVTSDALLLATPGPGAPACEISVLLRTRGADLVARAGEHFCGVRDVPWSAETAGDSGASCALFLGEVHRAMASVSARHSRHGRAAEPALALADGAGLPEEQLAELVSQMGSGTRRLPGSPAVALAKAGVEESRLPVDFLHSRLEPPAKKLLGRRALWAAGAAAAVLAAALFLAVTWRRDQAEVDKLTGRLAGMKQEIDTTKGLVDRVSLARGWYEERPRMLDCLRELADTFPAEGRVWVTNLTIKPAPPGRNLRGVLSGKARDEKAVLDTLDQLKKSKSFTELKLMYMREAGRTNREVSFAAGFTFVVTE